MPEDLLSQTSILAELRKVMTEDACQDVEIIGWLYQFYISEKKDQVFASLKKNVKITAENIPAATQLFTPHWIVRYLVENSLGRLWLLNNPHSGLAAKMDYYIAPEEPETDFLKITKPEDIRICDPAAGSGHMLTYAFDLLYAIYEEEGYDATEIPALILTHNLTGVEIDDRAGALAAFALAMKAAAKLGRRRFLRMEAKPDICVLQEHRFKISEFNDFLTELGYDLNVDRLAQGLTKTPLVLNEFWHCVSRYLKHADGSGFESMVENAMHVFDVAVDWELGLFEEASQNPFVLSQIQDVRSELLSIAAADKAASERKQLETAFKKRANSPNIAERLSGIGKAYAKHKNDTTYRMALDALVDRIEEATKAPEAYGKLVDLGRTLSANIAFHAPLWVTLKQFEQAKNFGSLIVPKLRDPAEALRVVEARDFGGDLLLKEVQERVIAVLRMAEALSPKYHVVVANPPYMGSGGMNAKLSAWTKKKFPDSKTDLYSAFFERSLSLVKQNGLASLITIQNWMFLSSFEKFRINILEKHGIRSLIQIGYNSFPELNSKVAQAAACVVQNKGKSICAEYFNLNDAPQSANKKKVFLEKLSEGAALRVHQDELRDIPGYPIAYWISQKLRSIFGTSSRLGDLAKPRQGLASGDNDRFMRFWHEIDRADTSLEQTNFQDAVASGFKWFPHNKGGAFRKWYGNNDFVLAFDEANYAALANMGNHLPSRQLYFKEGMSWTALTSGKFNGRFTSNSIFDAKGPVLFANEGTDIQYFMGFCNSTVATEILKILAPTLDFNQGPVGNLPILEQTSDPTLGTVSASAKTCVGLAKSDWNASETSWDFTTLPLLQTDHHTETLEATYATLRTHWQSMTDEMQRLEEENNRIFIDAYGLQDELTPEVPRSEITLTCNPAYRYGIKNDVAANEARLRADTMAEFLSYAVGCMFGRYSLDAPGLILANQGETLADYLARVPDPTFMPDEDNIIPVLDADWFADDITDRFRLFLRTTFGEAHFRENLRYIEDALGKDIRKYFTKDFYEAHWKRYKKRPIYWMFSSPKGTFNALIYMHRYQSDTVSVLLNDYLREFITKLEGERARLDKLADDPTATQGQKTKALKDAGVVAKQIDELNEWEREVIFPLAQQKIEIDLDDGVKANYPKFGAALKKIVGVSE